MNLLLKSLTNRGNDFLWGDLNDEMSFVQEVSPADVLKMWQFMQLDRTDTDYFVLSALALLELSPEWKALLKTDQQSYELFRRAPAPSSTRGAQLMGDRHGPPKMLRYAAEWPAVVEVKVSWVDESNLKITLGTLTWFQPIRANGQELLVEWPEETGVSGRLVLRNPWMLASEVKILHTPTNYPTTEIVRGLADMPELYSVLDRGGLAETYSGPLSADEKVAVLLTSLTASHTLQR